MCSLILAFRDLDLEEEEKQNLLLVRSWLDFHEWDEDLVMTAVLNIFKAFRRPQKLFFFLSLLCLNSKVILQCDHDEMFANYSPPAPLKGGQPSLKSNMESQICILYINLWPLNHLLRSWICYRMRVSGLIADLR